MTDQGAIASASTATKAGRTSTMLGASKMPWVPFALEGTFFKPLHLDDDQGKATFMLKIPAGAAASSHKHLAAVEAYVVSGGFTYEGEGTVGPGDYVYEPGGIVHEPAAEGADDLILFVVAQGPVQGMDAHGTPLGVIDNDVIYDCALKGGVADHLR
ncbi:2,4'-dihydroxyacetophenone dioxygenase family protein [Yunchengibacter salinarum]|uniref:2,4'-dihydroxyacetophenone dioxygenase family protein n=1 Tax=Yunchengibacter salinarum TaxID=3133399 RepID=UPI0035B61B35